MLKILAANKSMLAVVALLVMTLGAFQNCGGFRALPTIQVYAGSSYCLNNSSDAICTSAQSAKCTFNGSTVAEGSGVTAYLTSNGTCTQETRTCTGGALSGSYQYASCSGSAAASCLFNGQTIASGQPISAYLNSTSTTCTPESRTCTNGSLSGSYPYSSCSSNGAASCLFNGQTIAHGQSVTAYEVGQVAYGSKCTPITRTCLNGALTGSGNYGSCAVSVAASCLFNGQTIPSGGSVTAFANSTVASGGTCASETRTCTNGALSGTANYGSCIPGSASACFLNGQTIPSGSSVTLYTTPAGTWTTPCSAEVRTCAKGVIPGNAIYSSCVNPVPQANFSPVATAITPFANERLLTVVASNKAAGQNGQWWCDQNFGANFGGNWRCLEVSGGGSCFGDVEANAAIACVQRTSSQSVTATSGPTAGQTGQWWCDAHFGGNLGGQWLCLGVSGSGSCSTAVGTGTQISCQPLYNPKNLTVPSGPTAGQTGQWWCANNNGSNGVSGTWKCATQTSPAGNCAGNSNAGSVVTCEQIYTGSGDGRYIDPDTSCTRDDLDDNSKVFCANTDYMKYRTTDTTYLMNRYVRIGVNRAYGGTLFELYGTDFRNRIEEHGGSAIQLSVWGYDANGSGAAYFTTASCNPTPFSDAATCQANNAGIACDLKAATGYQISNCSTEKKCGGWSAGAPINPIQAQGVDCGWDRSSAAISAASGLLYGIHVEKQAPYNFTKTSAVPGMHWGEDITTPENAPYVKVTYTMIFTGASLGLHDQEIPAFFTDNTLGAYFYFYEDGPAYSNSNSAVTRLAPSQIDELDLPNRSAALPAHNPRHKHFATEEWMSSCDATETRCVTIAAFAASAPDVTVFNTAGQYITPMGRFALSSGLTKTWTVYYFPYRFDAVVEGKSVRQWIYEIKQ